MKMNIKKSRLKKIISEEIDLFVENIKRQKQEDHNETELRDIVRKEILKALDE